LTLFSAKNGANEKSSDYDYEYDYTASKNGSEKGGKIMWPMGRKRAPPE